MRKAIFIFIAIVLVAASIDWIRSCSGLKSHKEVFGRELTYAEMYEYKDADYDYVVRVPSFFTAQADSLQFWKPDRQKRRSIRKSTPGARRTVWSSPRKSDRNGRWPYTTTSIG